MYFLLLLFNFVILFVTFRQNRICSSLIGTHVRNRIEMFKKFAKVRRLVITVSSSRAAELFPRQRYCDHMAFRSLCITSYGVRSVSVRLDAQTIDSGSVAILDTV